MTRISLTVNGTPTSAEVEPRVHLGDFLRSQAGLTGTHLGCEHGVCGACTVLLDGKPVRSCITFAVACEGRSVTTVEGYDHDPVMARLRASFSAHHALQCGYCTPGMLATARDIVLRLPGADEATVRLELSGNLCRCTGYVGIVGAIMAVLDDLRQHPDEAIDALRPLASDSAALTAARVVPARPASVSSSPLFATQTADPANAPAQSSTQVHASSQAATPAAAPAPAPFAPLSPAIAPSLGSAAAPQPAPMPAPMPAPIPASAQAPATMPTSPAAYPAQPAVVQPAVSAQEAGDESVTAIAAFLATSAETTAAKSQAQSAAPAAPVPAKGTQIEAMFEVAADIGQVWAFMADLPEVASCLPGAMIEEMDGDRVKGRIAIKFGPMKAAFAGSARLERDDETKSAVLRGAGLDSLSQSRATGDVHYRLEPASPDVTTVHIALIYTLQGPLAQFSRSGLVQDFVRRMVVDFGANVNARLQRSPGDTAPPPPVQQSINPVSIMLSVIWRKFLRLFGRG